MISIPGAMQLNAARRPHAPALVTAQGVRTHASLAKRVSSLAAGVAAVDPGGSRIGLLLGNDREHIEALLATAWLGRCAVPMDPHWGPVEVVGALRDHQPTLVFTDVEREELVRASIADAGIRSHVVPLGDAYEALFGAGIEPANAPATADYLIAPTGGTTSGRRGARISYAATVMRYIIQAVEFGVGAADVYLAATPLFHGGARSLAMGHLYFGGAVALPARVGAASLPATISEHGATTTFLVPTMLIQLADAPRASLGPPLRALISSGSRLGPELLRRSRERVTPHIFNYFASVEAGGISVLRPADPPDKADSVGRPVWGAELSLLGPDGAPVPPGQVGRVAVRGPAISHGYATDDPTRPRATDRDPSVLTGDLASLDADDFLSLHGRESDLIISGGINIDPVEIERVLAQHPDVAAVAVVGIPDARWGEAVAAVVVPRVGTEPTTSDLLSYVGARLASYKKPKHVVLRPELPLTDVGKVARRALREELARETRTGGGT